MNNQKIVFINYHMGKGGVERVIKEISNKLINIGYSVDIITMENIVEYDNIKANIIHLNEKEIKRNFNRNKKENPFFISIFKNIINFFKLKKILKNKKYDFIISSQETINFLAILTNNPVYIMVHNNMELNTNKIFLKLIYKIYNFNNIKKIITVSEGLKNELSKKIIKNKVICIYNPINNEEIESTVNQQIEIKGKYLLNISRLAFQKNQKLLIDAYKYSNIELPLYILGDGELRNEITSYIQESGLIDKVILLGNRENVFPYIKNSYFTILSSRYEGFGNVIIESMAVGIPVISVDCDYGPKELINNNGILVKNHNIKELSKSMVFLLENKEKYDEYKIEALNFSKKFDINNIIKIWKTEVLNDL